MSMSKFKRDFFGSKEKISQEDFCSWCYAADKKKVPVYACTPMGQSGWDSPDNVCRDCLIAVVNNEIENIRTCPSDQYDGKLWLVPFEVEVIYKLTFEGLN